MTMQSKFATYGEGVTAPRPVARYAPLVNPYHPLPDEEAYAAAWKDSLRQKRKPQTGQDQSGNSVREFPAREKYLIALRRKSPQTVPQLAKSCGVSPKAAAGMVLVLERAGIARRFGATSTRAVLWGLEAAE